MSDRDITNARDARVEDVYTQRGLEYALSNGFTPICKGDGDFQVTDARVCATEDAKIRVLGDSFVRLSGSAMAFVYDKSRAIALDKSTVMLFGGVADILGNASAVAYGKCVVNSSGSSFASLNDGAVCYAHGRSRALALGGATVFAYDASKVTAYAGGVVYAYDESSVRLYGNSYAVAFDNSHVAANDRSCVSATRGVAVVTGYKFSGDVSGGVVIDIGKVVSPEAWCEEHGVVVRDGIATLFKAVDENYSTEIARAAGVAYTPGSTPCAPDWDGRNDTTAGGLHMSYSPVAALSFYRSAKHFIACPVRLGDIVVPRGGKYPYSVKVRCVCDPCYEVSISGERYE